MISFINKIITLVLQIIICWAPQSSYGDSSPSSGEPNLAFPLEGKVARAKRVTEGGHPDKLRFIWRWV